MQSYKTVIIVGAGPAGIAAAIQLKRSGIDVAIIEKHRVGGLLQNANLVENYPGFPGGISGERLCQLMNKQLEALEIEILNDEVTNIDFTGVFSVTTKLSRYNSAYCIVATGTKAKILPGLENLSEFSDKIFYEVAEMKNIQGKTIGVIGSGDAAFDYAINLSKYNSVHIIRRSIEIKALPLLVDRASNIASIEIGIPCRLQNINQLYGKFSLNCNSKNDNWIVECDYILCAIGREPDSELLANRHVICNETNRFYAIGDVVNGDYRQTAICVGDGVKAAMNIFEDFNRRLNENSR